MPDASFKDYVLEQLRGLPSVNARAMFGGYGLFKGGLMFGLIIDGELYFKVNGESQAAFQRINSRPFIYRSRGKSLAMSYWYVPEDLIEDPDELCAWANTAYGVAVEAAARKNKKARRAPKRPKKK